MGTIKLQTAVPGPKSRALTERRGRAVMRGIGSAAPIFVEAAHGAQVRDVDGNVFLDFAGGIGVLAVGHSHPAVVLAVAAQAQACTHMAFQVAAYEPYVQVCERLCAIAPIRGQSRALLVSTGAEAVENAVKIARAATGRQAIVAFTHAFHGRTLLGMSLTGKVAPYKLGFGPFAPEVYRLPFPYCYRCDDSPAPGTCCWTEARLREAMKNVVAPEAVAAYVLEPVLGEGGFVPAPSDFCAALRRLCDATGALIIADEVQTGFGRTGAMFACETVGLEPDLVTMAKSLAGGLPLAAVVGRAEVVDRIPPGGLGGTYAGNPIACAAALAVLELMERERLAARAQELGERMRGALATLAEHSVHVGDVRGPGAMVAMELVTDRASRAPATELAARVQQRCLERGLIVLTAGTFGNVLRLLVPLNLPMSELDEGLAILTGAVRDG